MLCWVLRCLLQDSISIPGTTVGPLTATQGEFPCCAYTQTRWVRLSPTTSSAEVPGVTSGLNLPFILKHLWVLMWSRPELEEIFVEVSYCPCGALAGRDDIPLKTLPRVLCGSMLLHPHPHWALFQGLVNDCPFLQSQIQPLVVQTLVRQSRAQVLSRQ